MKPRARVVALVVVGLALVLGGFVLSTLHAAGAFSTLAPHRFERCARIEGFTGSEDAVFDAASGLVFFSSQDFRSVQAGAPSPGALFWWAPSGGPLTPLPHDLPGAFHPHGLGLLRLADGARRLFVVNHPTPTSSQVEAFDVIDGPALKHVRTFTAPEFISLNDVAPVGPEQFYVTLDAGTRADSLGRAAETFLRLPWAGLLWFDGGKATVAASGLRYANGVAVSNDGATVYVSETTGRRLLAYARDAASGALLLRVEHAAGSGLDNISVAPDGSLWVAAHPKMLEFLGHAKDPAHHSPSQVLRVRHDVAADRLEVVEVALDDGATLSGSSVALPLPSGQVVVGAVFERHALRCAFDAAL